MPTEDLVEEEVRRRLFLSPTQTSFSTEDISPEGLAPHRRCPPVSQIAGFREAVGSPLTASEVVEPCGDTPADRFLRTPSAASHASLSLQVSRGPTLASPRMVDPLSPIIPREISHADIQVRMGVPQPEREVISVESQGEEEAAPVTQELMEELRHIFEEVAEEPAVTGGLSGDAPAIPPDRAPEAAPAAVEVATPKPHPEMLPAVGGIGEDTLAGTRRTEEEEIMLATEGQREERPSEAMYEERAEALPEVQPPDDETLGMFAEVLVEQAEEVGVIVTEHVPLVEDRGEDPPSVEVESAVRAPSGDAPAEIASGSGDTPAPAVVMLPMPAETQVVSGDAPAIPVVSDEPVGIAAAGEREPEGEPADQETTDITGAAPAIQEELPRAEGAAVARIVHVPLGSESSSTTETAPMEGVSEAPLATELPTGSAGIPTRVEEVGEETYGPFPSPA